MSIKYNDNGTFKDIKVKVGDNIPVGAEFDYDGSTIPVGYEEVTQIFGIVESGSNTDGTYIKFGDGTLICRTASAPSGSWIGSCYRAVWTFPYSFIDTNYTITGNALSGNQKAYTVSFGSKNTNNVTIDTKCLGVNGENETCDRSAECIAIGKWK